MYLLALRPLGSLSRGVTDSEVTPATHISLAKSKFIDNGASSGASAPGPHRATGASPSKPQGLHVDRKHASKAQCAQCESTFETAGRRAEDQGGQGQGRVVREAAEEAVRSRSSTPEGGPRSRSRSKTPKATPSGEGSSRPQSEQAKPAFDWSANIKNCTLVVHSGESSPEGSDNAAKDEALAASSAPSSPPFPNAPSEKEAEDVESSAGVGDSKQAEEDDVVMADAEDMAEKSSSDAGSEPKAVSPPKHLTLAQGRERAQASKAAAATKTEEARAKKRPVSTSPRGTSSKLFSDSESEDEEGAVHEPKKLSNDLDEQQEQYHAARSGAHARQSAAATAVESSSGGSATYPQGYFPPEPGTGAPHPTYDVTLGCLRLVAPP
ncbi:hypothetical protein PHYSODRAFT_248895 [Phytophthora sojae]|uniref:Uncharacterized protein n=1 Tax=Phytophthora sojae (strain P6497) TaxID=1094619 RepID=G4ZXM2_PHYSP|nr:hypothetical protein PHYSODRAFT_248895 [Phytophthora sojae]EGZ12585.1 hypothetical protein PHYSODRAFT_248895 [Phytophthora sojae]|eukprot:XP_009532918.1 hypothetical protein PHYSODRAFT_248895 [Phytophthora sojae]